MPALRRDAQASEDVEEHEGHELARGDVAVAEAHASEGVEELDGRELAQDDVIALPVSQRLVSLRPKQAQMLRTQWSRTCSGRCRSTPGRPAAYVAEAQASEDGEELDGHEFAQDDVTVHQVGPQLISLGARPAKMSKDSMVTNLLMTMSQ